MKMGYGFDMILSNDLIDLYGKCGTMEVACEVFDRMPDRNVVLWWALQQGNPKESLLLFHRMGCSGGKPYEFTFSTSFKACGFVNVPDS